MVDREGFEPAALGLKDISMRSQSPFRPWAIRFLSITYMACRVMLQRFAHDLPNAVEEGGVDCAQWLLVPSPASGRGY